jgi:hypothetical protein
MRRLLIALSLLTAGIVSAAATHSTFYVDGVGAIENFSENPFPEPLPVGATVLEWGGMGPDHNSMVIWDNRGGPVIAGGAWGDVGRLTHINRPLESYWWQPGNSSPGMDEVATFQIDLGVSVWGDAARTELILDQDLLLTIDHYETENRLPYPDGPGEIGEGHVFESVVDDLFRAEITDFTVPFAYGGINYALTVEAFHESEGAGGLATDFWSPENEQSASHVAARVDALDVVPEPSSIALVLVGLIAMYVRRRF